MVLSLFHPIIIIRFFADVEKGIRKKALELEEFGVTVDIRFTPINEINKQLELLDTPGILWPKFEDQQVGLHLAMIGSINDEILNVEELALSVIDYLTAEYPGTLEKRFGFEGVTDRVEILGEIARVRGCLKKGNELDYEKAARLLMDDFRSGNSAESRWKNRNKWIYQNKKCGEQR